MSIPGDIKTIPFDQLWYNAPFDQFLKVRIRLTNDAVRRIGFHLKSTVSADRIEMALTTTEQIVKKDFALDADENRVRIAAHNMARALTAGMAMITCRDPLTLNIQGYLKQAFCRHLVRSCHHRMDRCSSQRSQEVQPRLVHWRLHRPPQEHGSQVQRVISW